MKAVLLAAGAGSRLRPMTDTIPKCLAPIQGKPLLGIWLELLRKAGVRQVLINVHAWPDAVREFLQSRSFDIDVTLVQEGHLLGSAGTLAANREWLEAEESFWVLYADVLTNLRLEGMLQFHELHRSTATLGVYRVQDPESCGILVTDCEGRVEQFIEKPADPLSDLAFAGILVGTPALLKAIPAKLPADLGFDVFPRLAGQIYAYPIDGYLLDIGTLENYHRAQTTWRGL